MKHIVNVTISNPAHDFVSMRSRQSTTNYMVEAKNEAEAILRASKHFKSLGHYVHNAVIVESTLNEGVDQIDESAKVGPENYHKSTDTVWHGVHHDGQEIGTIGTNSAQNVAKHGKWGFEDSRGYGRRHGEPEMNSKEEALEALVTRHKEYTKKKTNEEVKQTDEAMQVRAYDKNGNLVGNYRSMADAKKFKPGHNYKEVKEEVEQIDELAPNTYRAAADKRRQQADSIYISNNKYDVDNSSADKDASETLLKKADKLDDTARRRLVDRKFNDAQAEKNAALSPASRRLLKRSNKPRFTKANEEVEQLDELRPATYWNAAKKRNLQADTLPDNSTGSTDSAAQKIYKMANKLHNAGQKRAVDREENAKIDHVAATLSPATRKKLGINASHQFTKADGTVVRKEEVEQMDEAQLANAQQIRRLARGGGVGGKSSSGATNLQTAMTQLQRVGGDINKVHPRHRKTLNDFNSHILGAVVKSPTAMNAALRNLKSEEVEHLEEGPRKQQTRADNKARDARIGEKFKRAARASGDYVPPPEPFEHQSKVAHNKALGRALRKMPTAPVPGDKMRSHAIMVHPETNQRVLVNRTHAKNYRASEGWREVAPGMKLKKEEAVNEKAPPGAKYERMVKHIKDKYSEDGTLTPKEKAIAYATAWKAKNSGK